MIAIAPLRQDEFDDWLPLWRGYQTFYRVDIPEATTAVTFERLTAGTEPMGAFLAREGGAVVGMVHWIVHRSCWTIGDYCYLQDLYVAGGRRGAGVGRSLIEAVHDIARERGCSRVHWLTHETNAQAMLLYDRIATKSGFVQYVKKFE